ncbi:MAG: UDP-4-amino-4,6-dideoxy-N-acetyl-beta-L-altrosamine N-acetyltransferase [Anaerolineae bacterium]|nr:UDP-4-amino-4,6-dideoxy-N-acetyl-beta-L-altrosamine N-acetyltransferase [Anaerolineae bacterium]
MIQLRDVQSKDKELLRQWRNKPEVSKYMYTDHHITAEEHDRWFEHALHDPSRRYWIIVCDQIDVGLVNIYEIDMKNQHCCWAFYVADPSARGKGVGSFVEYSALNYVFEELGLNKLNCEVLGFNEAVVSMHRSFGFQQEGLFREHIIKGDQVFDVVRMAMLRTEWEAVKPKIEERLRRKGLL